MALEAIVFPQDYCNYLCRDLYYSSLGGEGGGGDQWCYNFGLEEEEEKEFLDNNWDSSSPSIIQQHVMKEQETNSSPDEYCNDQPYSTGDFTPEEKSPLITATTTRSKRRRTKNSKNKEEVENQRMTHIAVERNRRKQMNEYLAVLRSLMPTSYVQRGDQASIIGGAINFVKELEQLLQSLEAQKRITTHGSEGGDSTSPFANFFTFPQFSSCSTQSATPTNDSTAKNQSPIADIEVTMVESHASLKVLTPKRPKQLLKMVAGFQSLRLTILHLNVTTVEDMVLYSFNVKVEEDCHLTSVDEIATAVYQMLGRIQEEVSLR